MTDIVESLKAQLDEANAQIEAMNDALRKAGIEYPLGARGISDLAMQRDGQQERAEQAEAVNRPTPNPYELPADVDPEALGQIMKAVMDGPKPGPGIPHTVTYEPRQFMRPDEIAAEICGAKNVHVACVLAVLDWLAEKWETDAGELVKFDVRPYTIVDVPDTPDQV